MKFIFGLMLFVLAVSSYSLRENASRALNRKAALKAQPPKPGDVNHKEHLECEKKCKCLKECAKVLSKEELELCWSDCEADKPTLCPIAKCNIQDETNTALLEELKRQQSGEMRQQSRDDTGRWEFNKKEERFENY
eukprot:Platyproteum_vivax@DN6735_c0_g1_i1.p1